jgi:uncharacterized protein YcbK (DUF882 family)
MITRRQLLQFGGCAAAGAGWPVTAVWADGPVARGLVLRHLVTGEHLAVEVGSATAPSAALMTGIENVLRDPRTGERGRIDPGLIRQLVELAAGCTPLPVYDVLDAYRSPGRGAGIGLHHQGRAIDLRLSGVACADLAIRAAAHGRGGVGHYRNADFVHLDTGAPRCWQG